MALNYDFDMFALAAKVPPGEAADPAGANQTPVALFRDPATVAALERAPQAVQDYLRASYFSINCYHSGAPAGRYPDVDEAARIAVIEALAGNVHKFDLPRADDSQPDADAFHLPSFFAAVAEAEPIAMAAMPDVAAESAAGASAELRPEPAAAIAVDQATTAEDAALPVLILANPAPAADSATDSLIAELVAVADSPRDDAVNSDLFSGAALADPAPATDTLFAGMIAADDDITGAAADEELPAAPPPRRFRLPTLPRWFTAGAAFAVLGVAVGTAMI